MVTDAAVGGARTGTGIPYGARLAFTILLLGLYVIGHFIPLPLVNPDSSLLPYWFSRMNPLILGLTPLLTGFILVELFSLVTSPGRRLRERGEAGRAQLNRAALGTSLLLAALQAVMISNQLESMSEHFGGGVPLVTSPGLTFRLLTIFTLTAATAAVFVIGQLLSAYGIGNGFALLTLAGAGWSAAVKWTVWKNQGAGNSLAMQAGLLLTAGMLVALFLYVLRADTEWLPAFPQSVVPVRASLFFVALVPWALQSANASGSLTIVSVLVVLVLIPLFSWLGFHLFSSRRRLAANLEETEEFLDDLAVSLRRRTLYATGILALGTAAVMVWGDSWPGTFFLSFVDVVAAAAIALDLWDQFRFQRRKGATALLAQLDNVHFSYRLEERLQEEGIDALARGHVFRSLYFFLGPLFKIDVLVPRQQLPRARQVLAELEVAASVMAF
jgi:SecY translocase